MLNSFRKCSRWESNPHDKCELRQETACQPLGQVSVLKTYRDQSGSTSDVVHYQLVLIRRVRVSGSGCPCRRGGHVSESWLFSYGGCRKCDVSAVSTLSSCRAGGAAAAVGVERGERGERRGDAIPCITDCTLTAMRCKEGQPTWCPDHTMTAQTYRPNNSSTCCG